MKAIVDCALHVFLLTCAWHAAMKNQRGSRKTSDCDRNVSKRMCQSIADTIKPQLSGRNLSKEVSADGRHRLLWVAGAWHAAMQS
eukprot:1136300-Pelagomonas_calceolata.AAC.1